MSEGGNSNSGDETVGDTLQQEDWKVEKDRLVNLTDEDKEKRLEEKKATQLKDIPTWKHTKPNEDKPNVDPEQFKLKSPELDLNDKVAVFKGDITNLGIDCIVNAANESLLGMFRFMWTIAYYSHFALGTSIT